MTEEIEGLLNGSDKRAGFAPNEATGFAERFLAGHYITLSDEMNVKADLEKLVGLDEAWAICLRKPAPGWRLLGRFIGEGEFVASVAKDRHELAGVGNYTAIAQEMIDEWARNLSSVPVVTFSNITKYPLGIVDHVTKKK